MDFSDNHLWYCESGTTSARGVESGVGRGEFRQTGQDPLSLSHASRQRRWKEWRQSGIVLSISESLYSQRQIEHRDSEVTRSEEDL